MKANTAKETIGSKGKILLQWPFMQPRMMLPRMSNACDKDMADQGNGMLDVVSLV